MAKWKVYISSTFIDLWEFRAELIRLFENQLQPNFELSRIMERMFDDGSYTPFVKDCVEAVQRCDIYIIILGNRTGSFPPGEDRTYTEVELDTAIAHEKRIFCLRLETFDEAKIDDKAKHNDLLNRFEGRFTHSFNNTPELEKALYDCLFPFALQSPVNTKNPYKGLAAFGVEDGDYFFGRDAEIEACLKKIITAKGHSFVSVIGSSGTGKSSFVQAGLLYRLKHDEKLGFSRHPQIIVNPGSEAFTNLQYQLQLQGLSAEVILSGNTEFILFFDQFEEVITQCHTPEARAERKQLFNFLDKLSRRQSKLSKFLVICAFRSDFSSQLANYDYIRFHRHIFLLSSLDYKIHANNREQSIREIITQPALKNGIAIEKELTAQLIHQLKEVEGALPILQFSLEQLWNQETIKDRCISATDYSRLSGGKGMSGIIETHAEDVVKSITNNGKDKAKEVVLKSLFVNLIEVNENLRDVKRTVSKDELFRILKVYPKHMVHEVFELLVSEKSRLLQLSREKDEAITVSIIHEALIRKWERLKSWIDERREALERKKRILHDITAYHKGEEGLYRGRKLKNALRWKAANPDLSDDEINIFLLKAQKRRARRRYKFAGVILLVFTLALVAQFTVIPYYEKKNFLEEVESYETVRSQIRKSGGHIDSVRALTMDESNHIFLSKNIHFFESLKSLRIEGLKEKNDLAFLHHINTNHTAEIISLTIRGNKKLISLAGMENLNMININSLSVENNDDLIDLDGIETLPKLSSLIITNNDRSINLEGLKNLPNLNSLKISDDCLIKLKGSENLPNLNSLVIYFKSEFDYDSYIKNAVHLDSLSGKISIDSIFLTKKMDSFKKRMLERIALLKGIEKFTKLNSLTIENNNIMTSLEGVEELNNLNSLKIINCEELQSLTGIENLVNLNSFLIEWNNKLTSLAGIENLANLDSLIIRYNSNLSSLEGFKNLTNLTSLVIEGNNKLNSLDSIKYLANLTSLSTKYKYNLINLESIKNLIDLNSLSIEYNDSLKSIKGIENLKALRFLTIGGNHPDLDPEPLYALTQLKGLRLPSGNDLGVDIKRIQKNNPGVKIYIE